MICALVPDLSKGCTARRKVYFGGRRVFEFPVSKTASLIPSIELAARRRPARYRAKLYLLTTIRRLLRTKIAWPESWRIINADCKFASTEKSLSTFRQKLKAELSCCNCHGRGTRALAMTIVFCYPRRSSGLAGPRRIFCNRTLMGVFLPILLSSIVPIGDRARRGQALPKTYQHVVFDLLATHYSFGNAKIENQGG